MDHTHGGATRYLTDTQIAARFGIARVTVWRWASTGHFPSPVKLSAACTRWRESDVVAWEVARAAEGARA